jgi:hypothetical protein
VTNLGDASKTWDAICIIDASDNDLITSQISEIKKYDESVVSEVSCFKCPGYDCRIIYSPMGELSDFDDVRAYAEAAKKCIKRALKAGAKAPVLCLPKTSRYQHADLVALLGALQELYVGNMFFCCCIDSPSSTEKTCQPRNNVSPKSVCTTRTLLVYQKF